MQRSRYAPVIPKRTILPAILLGVGLGGFLDGIVLHQILQWHSMLSNVVPPVTLQAVHLNMFWDGIFHAATWIITFAGVILLWLAGQRGTTPPVRVFIGALLTGWAVFNLIEGLIDHHLLQLHNVREVVDPSAWNIGFLVFSFLLLVVGLVLIYPMTGLNHRFSRQAETPTALSVTHRRD